MDFVMKKKGDRAYVVRWHGSERKVRIPDTFEDCLVTGILAGAFAHNRELEEVILPYRLEVIEEEAFAFCKNLRMVSEEKCSPDPEEPFVLWEDEFDIVSQFPETLRQVGDRAFFATGLMSSSSSFQELSVGVSAFEGCRDMEDFTFQGYDLKLGARAFAYSGLKCFYAPKPYSVDLPDSAFENCRFLNRVMAGITTIGNRCFAVCPRLQVLRVLPKLCQIGADAFLDCSMFRGIEFISDASEYYRDDGLSGDIEWEEMDPDLWDNIFCVKFAPEDPCEMPLPERIRGTLEKREDGLYFRARLPAPEEPFLEDVF